MSTEQKIDNPSQRNEGEPRRAYEAPAVKDFFQPLVVLGSTPQGINCATPKPPKR